ncbi:hypothetical protein PILCRDRAFT_823262 [Piloderma croceum F 1598]|uniref:Uncharacterized protein n=1 Tax=Piloderma croceum (strain F 1598) TaxID=765440 RepID=A0A0C3B0G4_PILCF|nr:hypothetical protein PILCRDRAFT_823262 [Piloderma croceum F 1598]
MAMGHTLSRCRCLCGQKRWPSTSDFSGLESQLSQPLILPHRHVIVPSPSGNRTDVQINGAKSSWRADRPSSLDMANFETFIFKNGSISACYLNTSLGPCEQGNVPVVGVDARSVGDVQAAVKFAAIHSLGDKEYWIRILLSINTSSWKKHERRIHASEFPTTLKRPAVHYYSQKIKFFPAAQRRPSSIEMPLTG